MQRMAHVDWLLRLLEISCVLVWHLFFMMCLNAAENWQPPTMPFVMFADV